jgi:hemerythrin
MTALIEWTDDLALGEARMDATHREFVECLNALGAASDAEFIPMLDRFIAHSDEHFADENARMAATAFPPAHCHSGEHQNVLQLCRDVRQMVLDGKLEVGRVLARELAPWFRQHAQSMDAMLAYWLNLDEAGRAEAVRQSQARQAEILAQLEAQGIDAAPSSCGAGCEHEAAQHGHEQHSQHEHAPAAPAPVHAAAREPALYTSLPAEKLG